MSSSHFAKAAAGSPGTRRHAPARRTRFLSAWESDIGFQSRGPVCTDPRAGRPRLSVLHGAFSSRGRSGILSPAPPTDRVLPGGSAPLRRGIPAPPRSAVVASPRLLGKGPAGSPAGDAEPRGPCPRRWHGGVTLGDARQGGGTLGPERGEPSAVPVPLGGEARHCVVSAVPALIHSVPAGQPRDLARSLGCLAAAGWPCGQARQTAVAAADGPHAPREALTERVWRGSLVFGDVPPWCPARCRPGTGATAGPPKGRRDCMFVRTLHCPLEPPSQGARRASPQHQVPPRQPD